MSDFEADGLQQQKTTLDTTPTSRPHSHPESSCSTPSSGPPPQGDEAEMYHSVMAHLISTPKCMIARDTAPRHTSPHTAITSEWCYQSQFSCRDTCRGPSEWKNNFPNCGGQRQSPINIVTHRVKHDPKLTSFIFEGHKKVFNMSVENHGHSAHFTLPQSVRLRGGGLPATYKAVQFHLHWGENGGQGSEHSVDGERYPMELHIVHIKEKYGSLGEALNDSTGVAALAFFFEVTSGQNKQLDRVIEALGKVRYEGNSCEIEDFRLTDIIPQANKLNYYRYSGSLTTPGCDQAVVWTVFQQSLPISKNQLMSVDKQLLFGTEKPMTGIFRPVQNLNGRVVYTSVPAHSLCVLPNLITLFLCLFCVFGQQRCFH
ncbi:carbonic anhydrase 4-like [Sinocyclocheilus rhinocerous]|uniref:carbonic anhydrase 4-like n=1 Tax=Sinocyclocheilus rhinocerous TaxID=307959 RepID=UPI0007BADAAE|nr:PREDICTED: carbonic anhydrase 4-like [Sinocyclocheilus rhinocerous]